MSHTCSRRSLGHKRTPGVLVSDSNRYSHLMCFQDIAYPPFCTCINICMFRSTLYIVVVRSNSSSSVCVCVRVCVRAYVCVSL